MRSAAGWIVPLAVAGLVLAAIVWLVRRAEPRLAFFPLAGEDVTPRAFGIDYIATTIDTEDGERLQGWRLPRPDAEARVLYFHGNGGNLSLWSDVLAGLWNQRLDVTAIDYRGYGLSTGAPSEQGLYRDVDALLRLVDRETNEKRVPLVYWGRSLGTTFAAYAATRRPPDGVVLEAGFPSMRAVLEGNPVLWALSFLSRYRFPTAEWMAAVDRPTLVLHGDRDSVIPYRLGQRLYDSLSGPKRFFTIRGGDHNDLTPRDEPAYWAALHEFVASINPSRTPASPLPFHREP